MFTTRYGEAKHPGPEVGEFLHVMTCNPTTIYEKEDLVSELGHGVIGFSETAATKKVQEVMTHRLKRLGYHTSWSAPVPAYISSKANLRGIAGGAAVASTFPLRKIVEDLPSDVLASNRYSETHVLIAPHQYFNIISLYGPTQGFRYGDPAMLRNRLFSVAGGFF
eukprot:Skav224228  [mRNA]  locus=scaffold939:1191016:1191510:+ [translate_table: standard]